MTVVEVTSSMFLEQKKSQCLVFIKRISLKPFNLIYVLKKLLSLPGLKPTSLPNMRGGESTYEYIS